jgi:hypothetical protein
VEVANFLSWMLPSPVHCAPPTLFEILGKSQDTLIIVPPEISCMKEKHGKANLYSVIIYYILKT